METEDDECEPVNQKSNSTLRQILLKNELIPSNISYCNTEVREHFDVKSTQKANKKPNPNNYI